MLACSRHGLLPRTHRSGGAWEPFLKSGHISPKRVMRQIREEISRADALGIPWQRVIDAVRPAIARVWHHWSQDDRKQFLRHLRSRWDVFRHRMAEPVSAKLHGLMRSGQLDVLAGRIRTYRPTCQGAEAVIERKDGRETHFTAARVINCTGPRSDFGRIAFPLLADLRRRGLIVPDALGLGIETSDCAAISSPGVPSDWLYALGPLTRPAWWEITAIPEINAQVDRLVREFVAGRDGPAASRAPLAEEFVDLGSGI